MSADKNGLVEVYDATQRAYFQGKLIDVDKTSVLVQFDSADGKQPGPVKWFDWTVVREVPPPTTGQTVLEEGQLVEVSYADEGSNEKPAWWEAKILQKKGPYFKVHFLCGSFPDEACEEEKIRPATPSANRGMGPLYTKQTVSLSDTKVHAYFVANEALILSVRERAQLLAIHVDKKSPQLKLIGTAQSIFTGKMLIELHMKHHEEMSRMHSGRELLASKLESEKAKRDTGVRIEFPVEKELIGLVVGKNGKNIAEARRVSGVDVVEVDQHGPKIVVIGPTQESVEKARELLEYVTERMDVRDEQVGWLIGKAGRNFKEMQEKTKITRINVDKGGNGRQPSVIIVGTARSVAAARLYMDTHLEYFEEFQKEEDVQKRLQQEVHALEITGPRGGKGYGGKGEGGGKGSGRPPYGGGKGGEGSREGGGGGSKGNGNGKGGGKGGRMGGDGVISPPLGAPPLSAKPPTESAEASLGRAPGGPKLTSREGSGKGNGKGGGKGGGAAADGAAGDAPASAPTPREGGGKGRANGGGGGGGEAKEATPMEESAKAVADASLMDALPQRDGKGRGKGGGGGGGGGGGEGGRGRGKGKGGGGGGGGGGVQSAA